MLQPAETYGMCTSESTWAFFGPLVGLMFLAEAISLYYAWKTVGVNIDFKDTGATMYACLIHIQAWSVGVPMLAALGYSSADATYFGRVFLIWVFSISSVAVVVFPKVWKAFQIHCSPEGQLRRHGRVNIQNLYEPSKSGHEYPFSDQPKRMLLKKKSGRQNSARILTKAEMLEIQVSADRRFTDETSYGPSIDAPATVSETNHNAAATANEPRGRQFLDFIHGERTGI